MYRPNTSIQTTDLDTFLNTYIETIIAGVLNVKHLSWNIHVNNSVGYVIFSYHNDDLTLQFIAATSAPTHYPNNSNYRPDIIILMKLSQLSFHIENFSVKLSRITRLRPTILNFYHPIRHSHFTDWKKFKRIYNIMVIHPQTFLRIKISNQLFWIPTILTNYTFFF